MSNTFHQTVRRHLVETASSEPTYHRVREIANDLKELSKAVAEYLSQLQDEPTTVSLRQRGRSKSTTWRLVVNES
jgi:hypothetical protein